MSPLESTWSEMSCSEGLKQFLAESEERFEEDLNEVLWKFYEKLYRKSTMHFRSLKVVSRKI